MCAGSEQRAVDRNALYPYVAHHNNYMIPYSDVLSVSSESYFDCSFMLQLASFLFLGHHDLSQKIMQDPIFFASILTNKTPG